MLVGDLSEDILVEENAELRSNKIVFPEFEKSKLATGKRHLFIIKENQYESITQADKK